MRFFKNYKGHLRPSALFIAILLLMGCQPKLSEADHQAAGRQISHILKQTFPGDHEYILVNLRDYYLIDHDYYDNSTLTLRDMGFRTLGDLENQSLSQVNPQSQTVIRVMTNEDVLASFYHIRKSHQSPEGMKVAEFETEFSDGAIFNTNNNRQSLVFIPPPEIKVESDEDKSLEELYPWHLERIQEYEQSHPEAQRIVILSLGDAIAFQKRMDTLRYRHRNSLPGITLEELKSLVDKEMKKQFDLEKLVSIIQDEWSK